MGLPRDNINDGWALFATLCCVLVVAVSELSAVRVNNGVVQWTISSCLPGECYGSYSLQLSQCTIQELTILPALNLSDDAVREIYTGELFLMVN